ncbi:MAG: type I DNA topoisomerase [Chthonomonadales bacterium]|nr:type I DNA topoisomerase [Chthonomonadales bacterium]
MATNLIIVESPAKTKTLASFLGSGYRVVASMGHVRDLPEKRLAVDIAKGFKPTYVVIPERSEQLKRMEAEAKKADRVYLASDPDREGEAIAYHVAQALKLKDPLRIEFNEITRSAVTAALQQPRQIDSKRVEAQEARRILDRLVGYKLSPLLQRRVRGQSAGRVQSVVLRIICDREREIQAFVPEEYWSLTATLSPQAPAEQFPFEAKLIAMEARDGEQGTTRDKRRANDRLLKSKDEAEAVVRELEGALYRVASVKQKEQRRSPQAPFTTSTMQQEASRKLGFSNRRTMQTAQALYEGVALGSEGPVGLITYMRSDSVRVARESQDAARAYIKDTYGEQYCPKSPPLYRTKGAAQDAHEAIRPTSVLRTPEGVAPYLKPDQLKLYRLIWQRFVASQMSPAVFDVTTADIKAGRFTFRATGSVRKFDGFMRVYTEGKDTAEETDEDRAPLPPLTVDQALDLLKLDPKQHFTEPPPRYTEATLVKFLDEKGIGRPSTWASFIAIIQDRKYVKLEDRKFVPTELGFKVCDFLVERFPDIMDIGFTARMETQLDEVEKGVTDRLAVLEAFWGSFEAALDEARKRDRTEPVETEFKCPTCGRKMLLRESERGPFLGCSGYPRCKTMLNPDGTPIERAKPEMTEHACPKCGKPMVVRQSARGPFLGCSAYPQCRGTMAIPGAEPAPLTAPESTGVLCPKDGGEVVAKQSRKGTTFYGCANYPACDFAMWGKPVGRACPQCGWPMGEEAYRGRRTGKVKCSNKECGYTEEAQAASPEGSGEPGS